MKKCSQCHTTLDNDAIFCHLCGSSCTEKHDGKMTIGRASDNDIILDDQTISSHHAVVILKDGHFFIQDIGSLNGTYVNGKRVTTQVAISDHDFIVIAKKNQLSWDTILLHLKKGHSAKTTHRPCPKASDMSIHKKNRISIGRAEDNDYVIPNIKVSRYHAVLENKNGVWYIKDLNSKNGIFVNGNKVTEEIASQADVISIGGFPLDIGDIFQTRRFSEKVNLQLTANNLSFRVPEKTILSDVSLTINAGEFVGLIGPSGAGKTTLMLLLNGVNRPSIGKVSINSLSIHTNKNLFKGQIGYVPQDDIIHKELTVKESLIYSSKIRLGNLISNEERQKQVLDILETLDLIESRNTLIGSPEKKGISGGQRKRVNMAQELITEPSVLFLDEPTSGLDPQSDKDVMKLLRQISDKGKIVVLTTHNITESNFAILTHLIVVAKGGYLAYYGPSREAAGYFGVSSPEEIFQKLNEKPSEYWKSKYDQSIYYRDQVLAKAKCEKRIAGLTGDNTKLDKGGIYQWITLLSRYSLVKFRDTTSFLILLLQAPIIALFLLLAFKKPDQALLLLFIICIATIWFGCQNAAKDIVQEQTIFKRERMVNLSLFNYLSSKYIALSALCFLQSTILALTCIISKIEINITAGELILMIFMISITAMSLGFLISSISKTTDAAMAFVPIVLIPQVILGGGLIKFVDMDAIVELLSVVMISRWGFEMLLVQHMYPFDLDGAYNLYLPIYNIILLLFLVTYFLISLIILNKRE